MAPTDHVRSIRVVRAEDLYVRVRAFVRVNFHPVLTVSAPLDGEPTSFILHIIPERLGETLMLPG